jgi:hypothetical protein
MRSFRSLSTRLTVQFALLFAAAMLVVSAALSTFIAGSASREVESQLVSSGAVYDRLWQQRSHELQNAAQLLARDFGFRSAVATGDAATMQSALGNAAARLKVRTAFIVSADGKVHGIDNAISSPEAESLWKPLDEGRLTGVVVLAGRPRQLVSAPVLAPTLIGWVVFASDLDRREMRSLERLSAIPLHAAVLVDSGGSWLRRARPRSSRRPGGIPNARWHRRFHRAGEAAADLLRPRWGDPPACLSESPGARRRPQAPVRARRHDLAWADYGRICDVARGRPDYSASRAA